MEDITEWQCNECEKKNFYTRRTHRSNSFVAEMKVLQPKRIRVKCKHCKKQQSIEIYEL